MKKPPEPIYSFTIPSLHDDMALKCRIYHPATPTNDDRNDAVGGLLGGGNRVSSSSSSTNVAAKAAIVAHPYAPMGGTYDDPVVMAVVEELVGLGFVVGTFNFRGAGNSKGKTSWTGKAERQDYVSFVGLVVYYLHYLDGDGGGQGTPRSLPGVPVESRPLSGGGGDDINLILGGYSYGSLILTQLPATQDIIDRFENAELGTSAAEIVLRARTLASQTIETRHRASPISPVRGRTFKPSHADTAHRALHSQAHAVTYGGEETPPSMRRASRESRRSVEVVRKSLDVPRRLKSRMRSQSSGYFTPSNSSRDVSTETLDRPSSSNQPEAIVSAGPRVKTRYLLISPLLPPISHALRPSVSLIFSRGAQASSVGESRNLVCNPTLAVFGSKDTFTSSKKLCIWANKLSIASEERSGPYRPSTFKWLEVEGAGHFWREADVEKQLCARIAAWSQESAVT